MTITAKGQKQDSDGSVVCLDFTMTLKTPMLTQTTRMNRMIPPTRRLKTMTKTSTMTLRSLIKEEDLYHAILPPHELETSGIDDDTHIEIQRTHELVLTSVFMANHHGELYLMYRWTSTFIAVPVCI
jgi:hypothetical protein